MERDKSSGLARWRENKKHWDDSHKEHKPQDWGWIWAGLASLAHFIGAVVSSAISKVDVLLSEKERPAKPAIRKEGLGAHYMLTPLIVAAFVGVITYFITKEFIVWVGIIALISSFLTVVMIDSSS